MISMTCSCKGEFWVRDRLAGTSTHCPSCDATLAVPSLDEVRTSLSPVACSCGEVFWSSDWQPGRLSKCPICGDVVGTGKSSGEAAVFIPPESRNRSGPALQARAGRAHSDDRLTLTGVPDLGQTTTVVATKAEPAPAGPASRRQIVALVGVAIVMLAAGALLGPRLVGPSTGREDARPSAPGGGEPGTDLAKVAGPDNSTDPLIDRSSLVPLKLLVPAYFYPAGPGLEDWKRLIDSAGRHPIVAIVNPSSGPGEAPIRDYTDIVSGGTAAGLTMIGYVNTAYAARSRREIEADIDRWVRFYPEIQGFFLDAQAIDAKFTGLYSDLRDYARQKIGDALIVSNPGTICDEEYLKSQATDIAVIFENSQGFEEFIPPYWTRNYQPERFAALPYSVATAGEMEDAVREAVRKGIGHVYVCDGGQPNPWGGLPPYWEAMLDAVDAVGREFPRDDP